MRDATSERWRGLSEKFLSEHDPDKLKELVCELRKLLDDKMKLAEANRQQPSIS